jgi:hypothetical protein
MAGTLAGQKGSARKRVIWQPRDSLEGRGGEKHTCAGEGAWQVWMDENGDGGDRVARLARGNLVLFAGVGDRATNNRRAARGDFVCWSRVVTGLRG